MRSRIARSTLRTEVLLESGNSTTQSAQLDAKINQMLNRLERQLALRHSWPMQTFEIDKTATANTQFHDFPAGITFTMVKEVWVLFGSQYLPVGYGIGPAERSLYSAAQRAAPIRRWEYRGNDPTPDVPSFEVWPIGATDQTVRFTGELVAGAMAADGDLCQLDADALVQAVAAELLAKSSPEEARLKMANADSIIKSLLSRQVGQRLPDANLARRPGYVPRPWIDFVPPS